MTETQSEEDVPDLTVSEAARIARLSVDTIRRYSDSGKLRSFRTPSNQRRFLRSDVEALLTLSPSTPTARPVDDLPPVSAGRASSSSKRTAA